MHRNAALRSSFTLLEEEAPLRGRVTRAATSYGGISYAPQQRRSISSGGLGGEGEKGSPKTVRSKTLEWVEATTVAERGHPQATAAHRTPRMSLDFSKVGLVGRQAHLQELQQALQSSETTAIFLDGASGVGKTALVRHFLQQSSAAGGTDSFVLHGTGKFDQYALAAVPFTPILQALGRLIDALMKMPTEPRQRMQGRIHRSLNSSQRKTLQRLVPNSRQLWAMLPSLKGRRRNLMASIPNVESEMDEPQSLCHSPAQTLLTLQSLVRALAADADTHVVIVLEDLHWASPESIDLVREMFVSRDTCSAGSSGRVKLLATYRSVTPSVTALRQAVERSRQAVCQIPVTDLEFASTHQLLTHILNVSTPTDTIELAEVIHQKTRGNPDFVLRFLEHLTHTHMLEYSMTKFRWVWDIRVIQTATNVTDNVVQVLTQQIHRLSPEAEEVLSLAGCLGFYFGIAEIKEIVLREDVLSGRSQLILPPVDKSRSSHNLPVVLETPSLSGPLPRAAFSERVVTANESSAMSQDLLARSKSLSRRNMMMSTARSGAHRKSRYVMAECRETVKSIGAKTLWLASLLGQIEKEGLIERASDWQYKFSHNQVQQACYEMTPPGRGRDLRHLRIGRLVRDTYTAKLEEAAAWDNDCELSSHSGLLFVAVEHLNKVSDYIKNTDERISLIELNLAASSAAEQNSSFFSAAKYLRKARALLQIDPLCDDWKMHPQLALAVFNASAEAERACGNFDEALLLASTISSRFVGVKKLRATRVTVDCLGVQMRSQEAINEACQALDILGEAIPRRFGRKRILLEVFLTKIELRKFSREDLVSLPEMKDPSKREAIRFLDCVFRFAWQSANEDLLSGAILRLMRLTMSYGQCEWTSFVYATFAMLLSACGDVRLGQTFVELSEDMLRKREDSRHIAPKTKFVVYTFANHFTKPNIHGLEQFLDAHRTGLETGELESGSLALSSYASLYVAYGLSLKNFLSDMLQVSEQLAHFRQDVALMILRPCWQFAMNLSGEAPDPSVLTGEAMDVSLMRKEVAGSLSEFVLLTLSLIISYMFDDLERAIAIHTKITISKTTQSMAVRTHFLYPFRVLYSGLLMWKLSHRRPVKFRRLASRYTAELARMVKQGAVNVYPMYCLLKAEAQALNRYDRHFVMRKRRTDPETMRKDFDTAIVAAARSGMIHLQALANERAAIFVLKQAGNQLDVGGWAGVYLTRAVQKYADWGASAKVALIRRVYGHLLDEFQLEDTNQSIAMGVASKGRSRFGGGGMPASTRSETDPESEMRKDISSAIFPQ